MKRIYKYDFPFENTFAEKMPCGAQILAVQVQRNIPCLWALVDTTQCSVWRRFYAVGTGHPFHEHAESVYVGTFQMLGGELVWHLFDGGEEPI